MRFKHIILFFLLLFSALASYPALSQQFSYVYIQGDKQTPFYVKLEGQMQPRYGKNYSIISQLAPGIVNIEILFQQNIYPPQHFAIKVPENGSRAFLLNKKGNSFSLYDLQQQFYIGAGNSADDDHIPTYNPGDNYVATNTQPMSNAQSTVNSNYGNTYNNNVNNSQTNTNALSANDQYGDPPAQHSQPQSNEPQFIDNVELNNDRTVQNSTPAEVQNNSTAGNNGGNYTATTGVEDNDNNYNYTAPNKETETRRNSTARNNYTVNSNCPQSMPDNSFQDLYGRMNGKSEGARLKFLLGRLDNCYSTSQIRMLTKGLSNDPERYAFLKQAYPRVTDQGNFASLENLLTTREWKDYFRLIMP
ncbi:MAG: DUF4476 domain-containing protein [Bacteroidetes bacterium]|nr:DUF4476 domain-containing protein [Bacteroidota bacterium]